MTMLLNDEQTMLQDSAREFCAARAPLSRLRELRDRADPDGFDRALWQQMVELGWAGIPWPEDFGGLGFGYKGLGVVTIETGRTLVASPLFATVWLAGTLIDRLGDDAQKGEWLAAIAAGDSLLAAALDEGPHHAPWRTSLAARQDGDGLVLDGTKCFVLDGHVADALLVLVRCGGRSGERDGLALVRVEAGAPGVVVTRTPMADSRNAAQVCLVGVRVGPEAILGVPGGIADGLEQALDIAVIGLAAEMLGSARECFERTVRYLQERTQFGVPIGSFQALKHRAATMFCELELSTSVVLEALAALDERRPPAEVARLASLAKALVGDTLHRVSREAVQLHGGIGMTDEFDIGFFLKRAAVAEVTLGDRAWHRDRYARLEGY